MGHDPPDAPASQVPPAGLTLARWLYVDARRLHEVHAGVRSGARPAFVVKESAFANDDPEEIAERVVPFAEPWEVDLLRLELENRLALTGAYWRHDVASPGWVRLQAPAFESLDLSPLAAGDYGGRVGFHHFRRKGAPHVTIAMIPGPSARGPRWMIARAAYEYPLAEEGRLDVVHARLPGVPATSILAREQMELQRQGYEKVRSPSHLAPVEGARWEPDLRHAHESILRRLAEGRLGDGLVVREQPVDAVYTDYLANLNDPRVIALHARFLSPEEERAALEGGEAAIRRLIVEKRKACALPRDNLLLTLLEASLLAREGLAAAQPRVDPEVSALVRRFASYL